MIVDPETRVVRHPAYEIADFPWEVSGKAKDDGMARHDATDDADRGDETQSADTQGAAVKKALDGKRSIDIDRWSGFSRAETEKLAADPAPPEGAEKSRAGLARDGGLVEGES